jgi:hypothetical protein
MTEVKLAFKTLIFTDTKLVGAKSGLKIISGTSIVISLMATKLYFGQYCMR